MEKVKPIKDKRKLNAMKKILHANNLRDWCCFVLGINCGLRISDLLRFSIGDMIDENDRVRERVSLREKKTGKGREFPINVSAAQALSEYLETRKPFDRSEPLFLSRKKKKGHPVAVQRDIIYKGINAAAREVGIQDRIGTHTMRKTFGYMALMQGAKVRQIQKILNHSAESVTLDYLDITQEELDDIIFELNL